MGGLGGATALAMAACAGPGATPEAAVAAYGWALARGDAPAVQAASDPELGAPTAEALQRFLAKNPATVKRAADAARADVRSVEQRATVTTASGAVFELIRRDRGPWRVVDGPLPLPRQDTPEHALQTYFFAARGHLELLRDTLPDADRQRFESDAALGQHLYAQGARIEAARAALTPLRPGVACVEGDVARIPWGEGRAVRLVRQDGTWRVVDLD